MGKINELLGIKPIFTTPYHPCCNGKCERLNGVLKSILRKICKDQPREWPRFIPAALFAIREMPNDSSKFSPFELLYGRRVRGPLSILSELWGNCRASEEVRTTYQHVIDLRDKLEQTAKIAAENVKCSASRYKTYFDRRSKIRTLKEGDEVLVLLPTSSNKMLVQWRGPYRILERKNAVDYLVAIKNSPKLLHVNLLKAYIRRSDAQAASPLKTSNVQICVLDEREENLDSESPLVTIARETKGTPLVNPELSGQQRKDLNFLLGSFSDVLSDIPGCTKSYAHKIRLTTTAPVQSKPYPVPLALKSVFDAEVDSMLEMGIIEPSSSPYCSPAIMVRKSDHSYRLCIDFRKLNDITVFDAEPMPTIDEDLHRFVGAQFISEIDIKKAYYQIPLDEPSKQLTAFATRRGLMQFVRLPFGLSTACSSYVRLMRIVLKGLPNVSCYFDNIYVYSSTWHDHLVFLEKLFLRLREHGLTAGPSKCNLGFPTIYSWFTAGFTAGKGYY
jgi:hypothetical protein